MKPRIRIPMIKICMRCGNKYEELDFLSYNHLCPTCRRAKKYWTWDHMAIKKEVMNKTELFK